MISRKTIYSLLLTLLVALGIFAWNGQKRDECDMAGANRGTLEVIVGDGGRQPRVASCDEWLVRQPRWVQAAALFDAALLVIFALSVVWDTQQCLAAKRRLQGRL